MSVYYGPADPDDDARRRREAERTLSLGEALFWTITALGLACLLLTIANNALDGWLGRLLTGGR